MPLEESRQIEITQHQVYELIERLKSQDLSSEDKEIIQVILSLMIEISSSLENGVMTLSKLKTLLGIKKTNGKGSVDDSKPASSSEKQTTEIPEGTHPKTEPKQRKGHGRNGSSAYTGAKEVTVKHPDLSPGDRCPECDKGTLREKKEPFVVLRIVGSPPIEATKYLRYDLICSLCGALFKAPLPEEAGDKKYDESVGAVLALLKYGYGMPFYRMDRLQGSLGVPCPSSTQWDLMEEAGNTMYPVYKALINIGAQSHLFYNDDTSMRILSRIKEIKETNPERKGTFTTGLICCADGKKIALYFTGANHAGENLQKLLEQRVSGLQNPLQMCDALDRNLPKEFQTILCNCLNHARSKFDEIETNFPVECQHILTRLKDLYKNDETCKNMTVEERLAYHQKQSKGIMDNLYEWMQFQLTENQVEPNSSLGRAMNYMLKRWEKFTRFLTVPGAPLDNNICERALKRAVLNRKNALFYKTDFGALIGDMFMSTIHTCELMQVNPFHYILNCLKHAPAVRKNPSKWLPWNYLDNLLQNN